MIEDRIHDEICRCKGCNPRLPDRPTMEIVSARIQRIVVAFSILLVGALALAIIK